jgi:hypothetical protein
MSTPADPDPALALGDHLRPTDADAAAALGLADGVYRVVGDRPGTVTLLRVGDAGGRRVVTGTVVTVERADLAGFEPAPAPERSRTPRAALGAAATTLSWSGRAFVAELAARPRATAACVALLAVRPATDALGVATPAGVAVLATLLGGVGLAYVGSGRLRG